MIMEDNHKIKLRACIQEKQDNRRRENGSLKKIAKFFSKVRARENRKAKSKTKHFSHRCGRLLRKIFLCCPSNELDDDFLSTLNGPNVPGPSARNAIINKDEVFNPDFGSPRRHPKSVGQDGISLDDIFLCLPPDEIDVGLLLALKGPNVPGPSVYKGIIDKDGVFIPDFGSPGRHPNLFGQDGISLDDETPPLEIEIPFAKYAEQRLSLDWWDKMDSMVDKKERKTDMKSNQANVKIFL
uniref:uncharacterized protein LOC120337718 n=1 Tax=Styela clava TaxID=7725 RepID=UPI00193AA411|nr:uncharacterized protein LOC120337718 [Styela clava]